MSFFLGLPGRPGGSVKLLRLDLDRSGGRDGGRFRLDGGFDLVEHLPRLQLRIGLRLFDADGFASLDAVVLIMGVILLRAADDLAVERSEERRVGKGCVSTCRSRWSPSH